MRTWGALPVRIDLPGGFWALWGTYAVEAGPKLREKIGLPAQYWASPPLYLLHIGVILV